MSAGRKAGFRAQKWFTELLWDLEVRYSSDLKRNKFLTTEQWLQLLDYVIEKFVDKKKGVDIWKKIRQSIEINFDVMIDSFGAVEVKSIPFTNYLEKSVDLRRYCFLWIWLDFWVFPGFFKQLMSLLCESLQCR